MPWDYLVLALAVGLPLAGAVAFLCWTIRGLMGEVKSTLDALLGAVLAVRSGNLTAMQNLAQGLLRQTPHGKPAASVGADRTPALRVTRE